LRVVGMKNEARVNLKINEPEGGQKMDSETSQAMQEDNGGSADAEKSLDDAIADLKI